MKFETIDNLKNFINNINDIVYASIIHGGDMGGPYFCNDTQLISKLKKLCDIINDDNKDILGIKEVIVINSEEDENFYELAVRTIKRGKIMSWENPKIKFTRKYLKENGIRYQIRNNYSLYIWNEVLHKFTVVCFSLLNFEDEYYLKEFLKYVLNKGFVSKEIKSYK